MLLGSSRTQTLRKELELASLQSLKYARDFARLYRETKQRRNELAATNRQLKKYAEDLRKNNATLKSVNRELQEAYYDTVYRLMRAVEYKDEFTGQHIVRMSRYSAVIAGKMGLPERDVLTILYAAPMHDVGKIGIPDHIISAPRKLTDEEFNVMKRHTLIGAEILADSKSHILTVAGQIALTHHERWNGTGYPCGLAGDAIPLPGRIVALADTFDTLISKRSYKEPVSVAKAVEVIKRERGVQFDPRVVDAFLESLDKIVKINGGLLQAA
jgi:putative two-component system response regulator